MGESVDFTLSASDYVFEPLYKHTSQLGKTCFFGQESKETSIVRPNAPTMIGAGIRHPTLRIGRTGQVLGEKDPLRARLHTRGAIIRPPNGAASTCFNNRVKTALLRPITEDYIIVCVR